MYLNFYRLDREPFHITPDPDFLFPSPSHNEALASIIYGVEQRKGFVELTGEVGTGKTTILRAYLRREQATNILPIYLFHPDLSFRDLVVKLLRELEAETPEDSTSELLEKLQRQLIEEYRENRSPVLIIDEAQNMPIETMEQLRMLTNLETSKDKLLQVVLVGQPELQEILDQHSLRQLKQRISVRSVIQPLTDTEAAAYIRSRIERAGGDAKYVFSKDAIREIVNAAHGIPRTINTICDNALIAGFGMQQRPVTGKTVREVARDLQLKVKPASRRGSLIAAAAAVLIALAGGFYWFVNSSSAANPDAMRAESNEPNAAARGPAGASVEPQLEETVRDEPRMQSSSTDVDAVIAEEAVSDSEPIDNLSNELKHLSDKTLPVSAAQALAVETPPADAVPNATESANPEPAPKPMEVDAPPSVAPVSADTPQPELSPRPVPANDVAPEPPSPPATATTARSLNVAETRVVKPGDCLSKLIADVYNTENYQSLMDVVTELNPGIRNPDSLPVGLSIKFPVLTDAQRARL
jgi:general secretion pathway protein A